MDIKQSSMPKKNHNNYHFENIKLTRDFSKEILEEMGDLIRCIVLFGSNAKNTQTKDSDIDVLVVLNNVSVFVTNELRSAYSIITQKLNQKIGKGKFHIMSINITDFWDMTRIGDPIIINILRYGLPIYDCDIIEPMQHLLEIGKIRPTIESINRYSSRAKTLLNETKKHLEIAVMDLYYATTDIVHSTLMQKKITPPSPSEMPEIFKKTFKTKKMKDLSATIDKVYKISKEIEHKTLDAKIDGKLYDELKKEVSFLIDELDKYNKIELRKKDLFYY